MMLKIGIEVAREFTDFNYVPPRPHKDVNSQDRTIVAGPGIKPAPKIFLPGNSKDKIVKEPYPYALIMNNLGTLLVTTVDKARGNESGAIVERLIKPRASKMFGHPEHYLDVPGPSISVSVPHEEFLKSAFGIWIGGIFFICMLHTNQDALNM